MKRSVVQSAVDICVRLCIYQADYTWKVYAEGNTSVTDCYDENDETMLISIENVLFILNAFFADFIICVDFKFYCTNADWMQLEYLKVKFGCGSLMQAADCTEK